MKVVIAEDDLPSRKILSLFLSKMPSYQIVGEANNGEELIRYIVTEKPDIALVDIELPLINGMDAIKSCKKLLPNLQIIFITGNDEYALEAFGVNAVDYIIKPIEFDRFKHALQRASHMVIKEEELVEDPSSKKQENKLVLKYYNNITVIPTNDIYYIEKQERKTFIHTSNKVYQSSLSLEELLDKLPDNFVQSHRSNIVNVSQIEYIESHGQTYFAKFSGYKEPARISKLQLKSIQTIIARQ
ncbi:LytTR family DNA-binding domain-containing protein [Metabacillus litoralis]|uniref:LytR/AlgR family response regulator transcription factor n=1 Tax=Metabacillus TaxID=2675233 RepID=UPI001B94A44A|nr:LytTR family DNA-binding domain-containing protein [Metabacillus litoralis]UHA61494.1 LytTR family DNA-binding domain-containing protein [Metabacillus litoralis]